MASRRFGYQTKAKLAEVRYARYEGAVDPAVKARQKRGIIGPKYLRAYMSFMLGFYDAARENHDDKIAELVVDKIKSVPEWHAMWWFDLLENRHAMQVLQGFPSTKPY